VIFTKNYHPHDQPIPKSKGLAIISVDFWVAADFSNRDDDNHVGKH
jgi:hypothetical protein